jgi:hypothetical protein
MTSFRSKGYIVMMIIAWRSLLHAIFEMENKPYFYAEQGETIIIDGDKKSWELDKCVNESNDLSPACKKNLKLFIGLRNKIEHRYVPNLDLDILGECQSLLLNFETLITKKFSDYYSLNSTLSIPLQIVSSKSKSQIEASRKFHGLHYKELREHINIYRNTLAQELFSDPEYSFRVYLIPKTGNHQNTSDTAMEFIKCGPEDNDILQKKIVMIKEKQTPVANQGRLRPSMVCKIVEKSIGRKFSIYHHTNAWKCYDVRKQGYQPDGCDTTYCQFDEPHKDYVYTDKWVEFLIDRLSNEEEYAKITSGKLTEK